MSAAADCVDATDSREVQLLRRFRSMTPSEKAAAVRFAEELAAGAPIREAGYRFRRAMGDSDAQAWEAIAEVEASMQACA